MKTISILTTIAVILCCTLTLTAQTLQRTTLNSCYEKAIENYPQSQQNQLIELSKQYTVENAGKAYLPQVSITAQATYQSDVTQVPISIPGFSIQPLSRDQYKVAAEVTQLLYDGGTIKSNQDILSANAAIEQRRVDVELYKLRERVQQLYFGVLTLKQQLQLLTNTRESIEKALTAVQAGVTHGATGKSNLYLLQAELVQLQQKTLEARTAHHAYLAMLSRFTGTELDTTTVLEIPVITQMNESIQRPELKLFDAQQNSVRTQAQRVDAQLLPKVSLFLQAGYARPGLNMLLNSFEPYYIGGVRASWPLSTLYTTSAERENLQVQKKLIEIQKATFLFSTNLTLKQQEIELSKYNSMVELDSALVELRTKIQASSLAQLHNGTITAHEHIRDVYATQSAQIQLEQHRLQHIMNIYTYQNTIGQ